MATIKKSIIFYLLLSSFILTSCYKHTHYTWESWSLQGEYSHLICENQYHEWVEVEGKKYFLGCWGQNVSTNDTRHSEIN